ncbi:MAG: response regulator [Candidatus Moranbacteria bacterium]|nr:response regulator [Candidatus Moranbacteria bacterium]
MAKILFVDSDPVLTDIYQRRFIASGFECVVASSVKEALQKTVESKFDMVLLELDLRGENGIDVLREIRTDPHYDPKTKVVIFSNSSDKDLHKQAMDLHTNGFISKIDYPPNKLIDETDRFLHQFKEQVKNAERFRRGGIPVPKHKKLLLVENEDAFIDMFGKRLRDEGYEVRIVTSGTEGFSIAVETKYDLVIIDMITSGPGGKELIARLQGDARTKDVPIFLFSASVDDDVIDGTRREGIRCFTKTHITPSELVREANGFLE